jgi:DUF1707 SHOCT-like domain
MTDDGGIRASDSDRIRASDSDRENVVAILREAYSAGRLTLEEFDERTTAAFAARTWGSLRELTSDLPHQPRLAPVPPAPAPPVPAGQRDPLRDTPPRRVGPMLPILVLWLGVAATVRDPLAFVPVFLILLVVLHVAGRPGRRGGGGGGDRPGPRGDRPPPGPG